MIEETSKRISYIQMQVNNDLKEVNDYFDAIGVNRAELRKVKDNLKSLLKRQVEEIKGIQKKTTILEARKGVVASYDVSQLRGQGRVLNEVNEELKRLGEGIRERVNREASFDPDNTVGADGRILNAEGKDITASAKEFQENLRKLINVRRGTRTVRTFTLPEDFALQGKDLSSFKRASERYGVEVGMNSQGRQTVSMRTGSHMLNDQGELVDAFGELLRRVNTGRDRGVSEDRANKLRTDEENKIIERSIREQAKVTSYLARAEGPDGELGPYTNMSAAAKKYRAQNIADSPEFAERIRDQVERGFVSKKLKEKYKKEIEAGDEGKDEDERKPNFLGGGTRKNTFGYSLRLGMVAFFIVNRLVRIMTQISKAIIGAMTANAKFLAGAINSAGKYGVTNKDSIYYETIKKYGGIASTDMLADISSAMANPGEGTKKLIKGAVWAGAKSPVFGDVVSDITSTIQSGDASAAEINEKMIFLAFTEALQSSKLTGGTNFKDALRMNFKRMGLKGSDEILAAIMKFTERDVHKAGLDLGDPNAFLKTEEGKAFYDKYVTNMKSFTSQDEWERMFFTDLQTWSRADMSKIMDKSVSGNAAAAREEGLREFQKSIERLKHAFGSLADFISNPNSTLKRSLNWLTLAFLDAAALFGNKEAAQKASMIRQDISEDNATESEKVQNYMKTNEGLISGLLGSGQVSKEFAQKLSDTEFMSLSAEDYMKKKKRKGFIVVGSDNTINGEAVDWNMYRGLKKVVSDSPATQGVYRGKAAYRMEQMIEINDMMDKEKNRIRNDSTLNDAQKANEIENLVAITNMVVGLRSEVLEGENYLNTNKNIGMQYFKANLNRGTTETSIGGKQVLPMTALAAMSREGAGDSYVVPGILNATNKENFNGTGTYTDSQALTNLNSSIHRTSRNIIGAENYVYDFLGKKYGTNFTRKNVQFELEMANELIRIPVEFELKDDKGNIKTHNTVILMGTQVAHEAAVVDPDR